MTRCESVSPHRFAQILSVVVAATALSVAIAVLSSQTSWQAVGTICGQKDFLIPAGFEFGSFISFVVATSLVSRGAKKPPEAPVGTMRIKVIGSTISADPQERDNSATPPDDKVIRDDSSASYNVSEAVDADGTGNPPPLHGDATIALNADGILTPPSLVRSDSADSTRAVDVSTSNSLVISVNSSHVSASSPLQVMIPPQPPPLSTTSRFGTPLVQSPSLTGFGSAVQSPTDALLTTDAEEALSPPPPLTMPPTNASLSLARRNPYDSARLTCTEEEIRAYLPPPSPTSVTLEDESGDRITPAPITFGNVNFAIPTYSPLYRMSETVPHFILRTLYVISDRAAPPQTVAVASPQRSSQTSIVIIAPPPLPQLTSTTLTMPPQPQTLASVATTSQSAATLIVAKPQTAVGALPQRTSMALIMPSQPQTAAASVATTTLVVALPQTLASVTTTSPSATTLVVAKPQSVVDVDTIVDQLSSWIKTICYSLVEIDDHLDPPSLTTTDIPAKRRVIREAFDRITTVVTERWKLYSQMFVNIHYKGWGTEINKSHSMHGIMGVADELPKKASLASQIAHLTAGGALTHLHPYGPLASLRKIPIAVLAIIKDYADQANPYVLVRHSLIGMEPLVFIERQAYGSSWLGKPTYLIGGEAADYFKSITLLFDGMNTLPPTIKDELVEKGKVIIKEIYDGVTHSFQKRDFRFVIKAALISGITQLEQALMNHAFDDHKQLLSLVERHLFQILTQIKGKAKNAEANAKPLKALFAPFENYYSAFHLIVNKLLDAENMKSGVSKSDFGELAKKRPQDAFWKALKDPTEFPGLVAPMKAAFNALVPAEPHLEKVVPFRDAVFNIWKRFKDGKKIDPNEFKIAIDLKGFEPHPETYLATVVKKIGLTLNYEKQFLEMIVTHKPLTKSWLGPMLAATKNTLAEDSQYLETGVLLPAIEAYFQKMSN